MRGKINRTADLLASVFLEPFFCRSQQLLRRFFIIDAFKIADAFLMPSLSEPFGTTALEAMGFGAPVVVSHQAGVSEMISTAFKADFWDTRVLADRILGILTYDSLAETMSAAGKNEIDNISYANTAAGTLSVYQQAMGVAA